MKKPMVITEDMIRAITMLDARPSDEAAMRRKEISREVLLDHIRRVTGRAPRRTPPRDGE